LPEGQSSGSAVASLLPPQAHYLKAFGLLGAQSLAAPVDFTFHWQRQWIAVVGCPVLCDWRR
jgi:hypothetical protein